MNKDLNWAKDDFTKDEADSALIHEKELTVKSIFTTDIFMQDNLVRHFEVAPHWHDCFEILLVLKGNAIQTLNLQVFKVKPNDLIIIRKGDVHSTQCDPHDDVKILVIKFLPQFIDSIYSHSLESIYITAFINLNTSPMINLENTPYLENIKALSFSMLEEFQKKEQSFEIAIKGYLSVLISFLVRLDLLVMPDILLKSSRQKNNDLAAILKFIEENALQRSFDLKIIARQMNFNYSYCSRYFKQHTGKGFHEFLTFIRICEAERMMINQNYSVTQAAIESGFSNSSVFSKVYKRHRGYSPKQLSRFDGRD